ncbi:MAG: DUF4315 family protein [Anaerotignaceae bacterium]
MSSKMNKLLLEIEKTKGKVSEYQMRLRELERQKTELENTEIVELIRSTKMNTSQLATFLEAFREKDEAPFLMSKQEEIEHEEK